MELNRQHHASRFRKNDVDLKRISAGANTYSSYRSTTVTVKVARTGGRLGDWTVTMKVAGPAFVN